MSMGRWLVWLAGGRDDVLRRTPSDRTRYVATGGVLLTTAGVAAVSATFALLMAVHLPLVACVITGVAWGVVILNLDRLLVTSMVRHRQGGWWRNVLMAVPRVGLALLLGAVISTPLVLQIFDPEIQSQMLVAQGERRAAFEERLKTDPRFTVLPDLQTQLKGLQDTANGSVAQSVDADEGVKAAQAQADKRLAEWQAAQAAYNGEVDGTTGSRVPGVGAASRAKQDAAVAAKAQYDQAKAELQRAIDGATTASSGKATTASDQIAGVQKQIDDLTARQNAERAGYSDSQDVSGGLLSRLEALDDLRANRPTLGLAQFMLFLLFMTLELLPVIVKLLQVVGPESVYETMIREMETDALGQAALQRARDRERADLENERQLDLSLDWTERQYQEGLRANEEVMLRQRSIVERSISDWAERAGADSAADVARFDRDHVHGRRGSGQDTEQETVQLPYA
jgi:hypothetical protein